MEKDRFIEAGKIINTHGVAGEVKIDVWLDSPEFFKKFRHLYIDGEEKKVISSRIHKGFVLASLEGVKDVNEAMKLKEKTVYVDRKEVRLPRGAFYLQDIIGARVVDESGAEVGTLEEIFETPASVIYVVRGETEHMIPAVPEFVLKTDAEHGIVTVHLIEGM